MPLSLLLQAVLDPAIAKPVIEVFMGLAVAGTAYLNKKSDSKTRTVVTEAITAHSEATEKRFDELALGLRDLSGIVVGPDGKNGMRKRQDEIRDDVKEIRGLMTDTTVGAARVDERVKLVEKQVDGLLKREHE